MADYTFCEDERFKGKDDLNILYIDRREGAQSLDGTWNFAFYDEFPEETPRACDLGYKATLPSSVYFNMYGAGLLPHPYVDTNSRLFRDLDEKIWYFGRKFFVDGKNKGKKAIFCADGIAYYCKVWLNGKPALYHEGMFGGPYADVTEMLEYGAENEIIIEVLAANFGKKDTYSFWNNEGKNREIVPWNLMHDNATSNGDFTVVGIWNEIRIEFLEKYHLARPYMTTKSISEDGKKAVVMLEAEIADGSAPILSHFYGKKEGTFELTPAGGLCDVYKDDKVSIRTVITERSTGRKIFDSCEEVRLLDFDKSFRCNKYRENQFYEREIEIDNPNIWDPCSEERAELYDITLELSHEGTLCDSQHLNLGIRTVTSERSAGRKFRSAWQDWQFVVNGRRIFVKGMNWTPLDFLYDISPDKYRTYLEMIKNQGVNMVRVWSGGGMPETETFYDICDELGLMVWQDHFPANTVSTKGWPMEVLESQEALNIYRLRKHPSLVLHCGGNEINPYTEGNAMAMVTVSRLTHLLDPTRIFHQAALDMGSAHIYSDMEPVWYGKIFKELPFLGESGIHSFPSYQTLSEVITGDIMKEALDLSKPENLGTDPGLLNHFSEFIPERVPRMLSRTSQMTDLSHTSIKKISEASQTAAYEFYLLMIQAMRKNFPVTTGAMPWVFKRPWPTVGVQIVDGYGRPLYQYYAVQNAFRKIAVMLELDEVTLFPGEDFVIKPCVIADPGIEIQRGAVINVKIYGHDLRKIYEKTFEYRENVITEDKFTTTPEMTDSFMYVVVSLESDGEVIARSTYTPKVISALADGKFREDFRKGPHPNLYFDKGPWLIDNTRSARKAVFETDTVIEGRNVCVTVKNISDVPAVFTRVTYDDPEYVYVFDDGCFTLCPGETKKVRGFACREGRSAPEVSGFAIEAFNA